MSKDNMLPGKWYITMPTGEVVRGPFETDREANLVRTEIENRKDDINLWVTKWDSSPVPSIEPTPEWYASTNEQHYTVGPFASREEAIQEMLVGYDETQFWTGRGVYLKLEDLVHVDLENIEINACEKGFDIVGDYIDGWGFKFLPGSGLAKTMCQMEINAAVCHVLREHDVHDPGCMRIVDVEKYGGAEVESKTDGTEAESSD